MKKILSAVSLATMMMVTPALAQDNTFDANETAAIEGIIKNYLLKNPEILLEVQSILMEQQESERMAEMEKAVAENWDQLANDDYSAVLGNPDGAITVVEFFDYQCGFCRRSHPDVKKLVAENDDIRLVLKQFPILDKPNETPISLISAHMAQAALKQGKFEEFHNKVYEIEGPITQEKLQMIVDGLGMDMDQFQIDLPSQETSNYLRANMDVARELGISSTPMFFINGKVVSGARGFEHLQGVVEEARAELN